MSINLSMKMFNGKTALVGYTLDYWLVQKLQLSF